MDGDLLKRIKRHDRFLRTLLVVNDPTDSTKERLDIMEKLVVQLQSELSDLAMYWSTELELHKSVYESSLLLPPLREPLPNPQVVGSVPVVAVATAPKIVHKSTASNVQTKKSVIFDNYVYDYPFRPERSETTNLEGSQSPDDQTVESILKFACDHHHCSSCNDFDVMKYETKQPCTLNGNGKLLSGATSFSTRAIGNQTDPAEKMSKFAANSIVHTATSNVQTGQGNLFVQQSLKRTSRALDQSIASGSSSTHSNIGHDPSKKKFTPATTPYTALTTSNQTDQDNSWVQRSLKRTSQTLMDHSIAPGASSSASASLYQPSKRPRTSNNELLRSKLMGLISATPIMNDYRDVECHKSLLRTVRKVIDHLKGASMLEDSELQVELLQMFTDKLHERARFRFFNCNAFKRNAVHHSYYLVYFEDFIKQRITYYRGELFKKATAFGNQLAQSNDTLYRIYCGFCKQDTNHSMVNCPVLKMVKNARICYHCLEDGHSMAFCSKMQT